MTRLSSHRYLTSHSAAAAQRSAYSPTITARRAQSSAYSTAPTAQRSQRGEHSSAYSPAITAQRGEHSAAPSARLPARRDVRAHRTLGGGKLCCGHSSHSMLATMVPDNLFPVELHRPSPVALAQCHRRASSLPRCQASRRRTLPGHLPTRPRTQPSQPPSPTFTSVKASSSNSSSPISSSTHGAKGSSSSTRPTATNRQTSAPHGEGFSAGETRLRCGS